LVLRVSCGCLYRNPHIRRRRCPIQFPKNYYCWIPILRRWILLLRRWKRSIPSRFRPLFKFTLRRLQQILTRFLV
jgi:hypothetical protein